MSSKRAFLRRAALAALAVGTVTALAVQPAMADRWKKNRGWYGGGYVVAQPYVGYYAPPPVVFYPPPPVVYTSPAVVYAPPPPPVVYAAPAPVYGPPSLSFGITLPLR